MSFVQRPEDVDEFRKLVGKEAGIMTKLEKPAAIAHLDAIIDRSDAVMVARGDLGVEMPPEDVPGIQKQIIRGCRRAAGLPGRPGGRTRRPGARSAPWPARSISSCSISSKMSEMLW